MFMFLAISVRQALYPVSTSVMLRSVRTLLRKVRNLFARKWRWYRTRPARRTRKREPRQTSAMPSLIGTMRSGISHGSYSRSASWMTTIDPVAAAKPMRSAAVLPLFVLWRKAEPAAPATNTHKLHPARLSPTMFYGIETVALFYRFSKRVSLATGLPSRIITSSDSIFSAHSA